MPPQPKGNHKAIVDWVRTEYGIKSRILHGGKHPYLIFNYLGRVERVTISSTPSDFHAIDNVKRDIKQKLGPPLIPSAPAKRKLAEMIDHLKYNNLVPTQSLEKPMQELNIPTDLNISTDPPDIPPQAPVTSTPEVQEPKPVEHIIGSVACYSSNDTINFTFPNSLLKLIDVNKRYAYQKNDDGSYEIKPTLRARAKPTPHGRKTHKFIFGANHQNREYFGATSCEFIVVDGQILVSLLEPAREVSTLKNQEHVPPTTPPPVKKAPLGVPLDWVDLEDSPIGDERAMQAVINFITRQENNSKWRLVKVDNAWFFRAEIGAT